MYGSSMSFHEQVTTKYHLFNSLFLSLPFKGIYRTGTLLPLFAQAASEGLSKQWAPEKIVHDFFDEYLEDAQKSEQQDLLFKFIQYVERQVVLFDAVEDAAFVQTHDMQGKGSLKHFVNRLDTPEIKDKAVQRLKDFRIRLVLTAHPTQFYPAKVLGILTDLEQAIGENDFSRINLLLMQLGKTAFVNREKPTPFDEAVSLTWYLENIFYHALPDIVQRLLTALDQDPVEFCNENLLSLGFWPGGDRDGNPFVTAEMTLRVAHLIRASILRALNRDIRSLKQRLTFRQVEDMVDAMATKINNTLYYPQQATYSHPQELLTDLYAARHILIHEHEGLFLNLLDAFILKVKVFGFHFASLDIRQDSRIHTQVWQDILTRMDESLDISEWDHSQTTRENEHINYLLKLIHLPSSENYTEPLTLESIRTLQTVMTIQSQSGETGCHRYIISNCGSALDVIKVLVLAKLSGCTNNSGSVTLDIVPLFETIDDLALAGQIMEKLYNIPAYQEHLKSRGNRQTIMVGFSDGTKDGGYIRANWSIYRAKESLSRISRAYGMQVIFFDGRGGPPGRGGGNNASFYASLGPEIENNEIQITVQGQTITSNYGTIPATIYNVERLISAGMENHLFQTHNRELGEPEKRLIDALAESAYLSYLDLRNHPQFLNYLEHITPLKWFGDINIGSRPVKRKTDTRLRLEDLRAIPFVGAWSLMKQNIPGFYGFGKALDVMDASRRGEDLKGLYRKSLFFRTLVENAMMAIIKSNFDSTSYLLSDHTYGRFWHLLQKEYKLTAEKLLTLSGLQELMGESMISKMSIDLREKIVEPLIIIQQYALQQLRQSPDGPDAPLYRKLVLRAMFGIINAARNAA